MEQVKKANLYYFKTRDIAYIAMFIALITICSWISIPIGSIVSFTLQLLAIFICIYVLGPVKSFITIALYLLIGLIGVPVFSNFKGGPSVFLGPTGGFLIGFLLIPLIYLPFYLIFKNNLISYSISMVLGLMVTYLFGALWFIYIYKNGDCALLTALTATVFPFIIPDLIKLIVGIAIGNKLIKIYQK